MAKKYPKNILTLISFFKKFSGVGNKTAERFVFEIIKWNNFELNSFSKILYSIKEKLKICTTCGCLTEKEKCIFCEDIKREKNKICIVASAKDAFSIEETSSFNGLYHVIEVLSPMNGNFADEKNIENLKERIKKQNVKEVIIALDSTLEGDATSLFIKNRLKEIDIHISRLAFGLPMGSSIEFVDEGTLAKAFVGRQNF